MITVVVVDDHEIVRRGVTDLIGTDPNVEVIGEAGSCAQALARIPALAPNVAIVDVQLPDGSGIDLCRMLLTRTPNMSCLLLSSSTDDVEILNAIRAGARGYVVKDISGGDLTQAVIAVGSGRSLFDRRRTAALMDRLRARTRGPDLPHHLTPQERTLLDLIGEGLTNRQIAERMFLAEKTVKNYVSRLLAKLGMQRRTQAAVYASRLADARSDDRPSLDGNLGGAQRIS